MPSEKDKHHPVRVSDEFKKNLDELAQRLGLSFEDLRVNKPTERVQQEGIFLVDNLCETDITIISVQTGFPVAVDWNEVSKNVNLSIGDKIKATIYSDPDENGMTSHWFFKDIKKL